MNIVKSYRTTRRILRYKVEGADVEAAKLLLKAARKLKSKALRVIGARGRAR